MNEVSQRISNPYSYKMVIFNIVKIMVNFEIQQSGTILEQGFEISKKVDDVITLVLKGKFNTDDGPHDVRRIVGEYSLCGFAAVSNLRC
ncbi:hypothetical protein GCM10009865_03880 [Aeromicrobium ponti]